MSQSRMPMIVLGTLGLLLLLGSGTWLVLSLQKQNNQTRQALLQTKAELDEKAQSLAMVEDERQKLSSEYDALKGRWAKTDEELRQATVASQRVQEQLMTASRERMALQQRIDDNEKRQAALQSEMAQLQTKMSAEASQRFALEAQVKEAAASGLTRAELEQLAAVSAKQASQSKELEERMESLSHAFEQLAWKHIELQEATGQAAPAGPSPLAEEPGLAPMDNTSPLAGEQQQQSKRQAKELARRYRHLGEFCLAAYQYPQAADAYEKSLSYKDDPKVHASLVFIYSRLMIDPEKAALHAAFASEDRANAEHAFKKANTLSGMPRKTHRVVWDWLTNK